MRQLLRLWERYQNNEKMDRGFAQWNNVFDHLNNIRPWGPEDRITEDAKLDWEERLRESPDEPIHFEIEFWFREDESKRAQAHERIRKEIEHTGGKIASEVIIPEIRYDAMLVIDVPAKFIENILKTLKEKRFESILIFDEVMLIRPQSLVADPNPAEEAGAESDIEADTSFEYEEETEREKLEIALLDGVPMARHEKLEGRLDFDDPDGFASQYGKVADQEHGTSMASLILHGDLNNPSPPSPTEKKLYVRPVMYPQKAGLNGEVKERIPDDKLVIDIIWRAFIRMFDGESGEDPTAPNVCVVNMSLGDLKRQFANVLSPWARLVDYLAWKHKVLIIVSAGNIGMPIPLEGYATGSDFEDADQEDKQRTILKAVLKKRAYRSLLSPAEGMNVLTIGAAHSDYIPNTQNKRAIDPYTSDSLPNLSSAQGLGYLRSVKPDILLPGGREHISIRADSSSPTVIPALAGKLYGIRTAAPGIAGERNRTRNFGGTSIATALATNSASRILDALKQIPTDPLYPSVEAKFHAVILKTLLVHASKWDEKIAQEIEGISRANGTDTKHVRDDIVRLLGYGSLNIERVIECTEKRATLIGWNEINAKDHYQYRIPIPKESARVQGFRAITATVGWLTPLNMRHRRYRMAKLEIAHEDKNNLPSNVKISDKQPTVHTARRGTVVHGRWEGKRTEAFVHGSDIILRLICKSPTDDLEMPIPYAIAVTLEVGEDVPVDVYGGVINRLRPQVPVQPQ